MLLQRRREMGGWEAQGEGRSRLTEHVIVCRRRHGIVVGRWCARDGEIAPRGRPPRRALEILLALSRRCATPATPPPPALGAAELELELRAAPSPQPGGKRRQAPWRAWRAAPRLTR